MSPSRRRRRGVLSGVRVHLDRERLAEMREAPKRFQDTARSIQAAACAVVRRGDGFGPRKAFLSDVAREVGLPVKRLAPLVVSFQNLGWLRLVRADLVGAMDPKKVADSEVEVLESRYHFVEVDPDRDC